MYIYESWATAIEWYISGIEYAELGVPNYNSKAAKQGWPFSGNIDYSPLFIDLVDDNNQSYSNKGLPANRCPYGGWFDGASCYLGAEPNSIPQNAITFIWNSNYYYYPAGNDSYPFDVVSGYTMSTIESNIIPHAYGINSVRDYVKANKPAGITDKHIDVLFKLYDEKY